MNIYRYLVIALLVVSPQVLPGQWNAETIKIAQVMDKVSRFYVDTVNESDMVEQTIVRMLQELDPHSSYLSKEELEELNEALKVEVAGDAGDEIKQVAQTVHQLHELSGLVERHRRIEVDK